MLRNLSLLVVLFFCYANCNSNSNCEQKVTRTYLNAAAGMIRKAKQHFPECADCECDQSQGIMNCSDLQNMCNNRSGVYSGSNLSREAMDCSELLRIGHNISGVFTIWPLSRINGDKSIDVYCDMQTDGGGWTVLQRRGDFHNPSDYFFKDWKSYKGGFGDIEKEFWLGNDNIFALTNQELYSVRFDLRDVENNTRYAHYDTFWIDDEGYNYTLHISGYSGDAGDSMTSKQKFSTKDGDNDGWNFGSCAKVSKGAWWYDYCNKSNLNGLYSKGKYDYKENGVYWDTWKGRQESMEATEIKIRPKNFVLPHVTMNTPL